MSMLPDIDTNAVSDLSPFLELANVDPLLSVCVFRFQFLEILSVLLPFIIELTKFVVDFAGFNQVNAKES